MSTKLWTPEETIPFRTPWRSAEVMPDDGLKEGVVDGDSLRLRIDVGFSVDVRAYCRLLGEGVITTPLDKSDDGVDAWETRGAEKSLGDLAEARVEELVVGQKLRVWSFDSGKKGKYGRWLVICLFPWQDHYLSLGDVLVAEGHAVYKTY